MTQKTFTLHSAYILSAIKTDGSREFYDNDSHSGGYPYWSGSALSCKRFNSLDKVPTFADTDYMRTDVVSIEVLQVTYQATVVSSTGLVSEAKAKAMAEIDKIQQELVEKIALLEKM